MRAMGNVTETERAALSEKLREAMQRMSSFVGVMPPGAAAIIFEQADGHQAFIGPKRGLDVADPTTWRDGAVTAIERYRAHLRDPESIAAALALGDTIRAYDGPGRVVALVSDRGFYVEIQDETEPGAWREKWRSVDRASGGQSHAMILGIAEQIEMEAIRRGGCFFVVIDKEARTTAFQIAGDGWRGAAVEALAQITHGGDVSTAQELLLHRPTVGMYLVVRWVNQIGGKGQLCLVELAPEGTVEVFA